jgi:protein ImuA
MRTSGREIDAALLKHPAIFRMGDAPRSLDGAVASGFAALDAELNGGWPRARLIEILCDRAGIGELSLLLPTLPKQSAAGAANGATNGAPKANSTKKFSGATHHERRALLILQAALPMGVPSVAYAPALERAGINLRALAFVTTTSSQQTLWAMEQALLSGATRAVFAWIRDRPHDFALRRISQAARKSESLCFLMRPLSTARIATPAEVRLALTPAPHGEIDIAVLKRRGLLRETKLRIDSRALACLAPHRRPLTITAPKSNPQIDRSEIASVLNAVRKMQFDTPPKIRERSFLLER